MSTWVDPRAGIDERIARAERDDDREFMLRGIQEMRPADQHALLEALAAPLGRDVAPVGWRATEHRPKDSSLEADGWYLGWYLGDAEEGRWSAFCPIPGGGGGEEEVGPFATAAEAAAAVERLAEEQRSGEAG